MKRLSLIDAAAAVAALLGSLLGAADADAQQPGAKRYSVSDTSATPASYNNNGALNNQAAANLNHGHQGSAACDACNECDDCCPGWYTEFEGLGWWRKSRPLPPLVTTSIPGTGQPEAGVFGLGTTTVLFGDDNVGDIQAGGRVTIGKLFGQDQCFGVAGSFFALGQDDINFARAAADNNDILAIPYFDAANNVEAALLLNYPGVSQNGRVDVQSTNDILGADVYGRYLLYGEQNFRVDAIGGYQFSRVDDALLIHSKYDDVAGLRISRTSGYEAARRGEIPTLHLGRRIVVPVAILRDMLGVDPPSFTQVELDI
jgi:hypothetical protein